MKRPKFSSGVTLVEILQLCGCLVSIIWAMLVVSLVFLAARWLYYNV